MDETTRGARDELTVNPSKLKLIGFAAFIIVAFGGAALQLLLGHHDPSVTPLLGRVLAGILVLSVFTIVTPACKRAFGGAVVTLTRKGLRDRRLSNDLVPWSAVTNVKELPIRGEAVSLSIDPAFAEKMHKSWPYRLNAANRRGRFNILTVDLDISFEALLRAVKAYRAASIDTVQVTDQSSVADSLEDASKARPKHVPIATISLMLVLAVVFAVEVMLAPAGQGATTLTATTLARYGGVGKNLVLTGQWWRLFTGPILHGGPGHLIGNLVALALGGLLLERQLGWRWFLACFGGAALAGAAATCLFDDSRIVSVGASGGIFGLFATAIVLALTDRSGRSRVSLLFGSLRLLIPSLLPTRANNLAHVDVAAHIGGGIGGLVIGAIAVILWRRRTVPSSRFSVGLTAACLLIGATILAVGLDAAAYISPDQTRFMANGQPASFAVLISLFAAARRGDAAAEDALKGQAFAGSALAATLLGHLYDPTLNKAPASAERTREAVTWYRVAAERNVPVAEGDLGILLMIARPGSPADPAEALRLLQRAAPLDMAATRALGIMYQRGIGVPSDAARALALIEEAAERGDLFSEKLLARIYDNGGLSTIAQPEKAVRMLRLAVMQGDPTAERELAEHFANGRGTTADPASAAVWYARAAARGDVKAQALLTQLDPGAAARMPPWGAAPMVIGTTFGDDAAAERARCLEQRMKEPANRAARNLQASFDALKAASGDLVRAYGRDERVRYARAAAMYDADRDDIAEVDLQCAVDDGATWYAFDYEQPLILTLLAKIKLDHDGHRDEARRILAPICASRPDSVAALDLTPLCAEQR